MIDASTEHIVDSTRPGQISWKPSDLLANYERLLRLNTDQLQKEEFNPYESLPLGLADSYERVPFGTRICAWLRLPAPGSIECHHAQ
jgi:hypothetical protein